MTSTSTTIKEAKVAIANAFLAGWAPLGFPAELPNEKFTKPSDSPWARLTIRHNSGTQYTLGKDGTRKFERGGTVFVQIFTPDEEGGGRATDLMAAVLDIFEGERISGTTVCFRDVIPRETGPDGKWYQVTIEATFDYIEVK